MPRSRWMERRVELEILDHLPAEDPSAKQSRRELGWINALMGNHRWLARRIRSHLQEHCRVLELGAGDGRLGARITSSFGGGELTGMDLAPRPSCWPRDAIWIQGDIFAVELPDAEIVVANMFLHHFEAAALRQLGERLPATTRVFLCSEPARRRLHLWQGAVLAKVARLGSVTRHDMPVSIRAGFLNDDLPAAFGFEEWDVRTFTTFFGAYRMEAVKR